LNNALLNQRLQQALGYTFVRSDLLTQALTHRSYGALNNERLEFLGDAVIDFVTAELLYHHYPEMDEGQLTRLRAALVRTESLAAQAQYLLSLRRVKLWIPFLEAKTTELLARIQEKGSGRA